MKNQDWGILEERSSSELNSLTFKVIDPISSRREVLIIVDVWSQGHILCLHRDHAKLKTVIDNPLGLAIFLRTTLLLWFLTWLPHLLVNQLHWLLALLLTSCASYLLLLNEIGLLFLLFLIETIWLPWLQLVISCIWVTSAWQLQFVCMMAGHWKTILNRHSKRICLVFERNFPCRLGGS